MPSRLLIAVALVAAGARANTVSDQISMNNTQSSDTNPRAGNFSDYLSATFDLTDSVSLDLGLTVTAESATPAAKSGQFGTSGAVLTMFTGGLDWDLTNNWSLGFNAGWAPTSTQEVGTDISVGNISGQALIQSQTSELDAGMDLSFDSAGDSDLEWNLTGGITGQHLTTDQSVTRAHLGQRTFAQLKAECAAQPTLRVCKAITSSAAVTLDSERFSGAATATAWRNNDFTVAGDLYHYEEDPKAVLYPSIAAAQMGMGMPIAPLEYLIRGEYQHKFGDLWAKLWLTAGQYEPGTGGTTRSIGMKVQYKFTKTFKMWTSVSWQNDVAAPDPSAGTAGPTIRSTTIAMGGQLRF
jgi:hypothetical protein